MRFVNSTVTHNGKGGIQSDLSKSLTLHNTIVAGNADTDFFLAIDPHSSNNLIGTTSGIPNIGEPEAGVHGQVGVTDPGLAPLGDYGGPTWTHALLRESPALDAGERFGDRQPRLANRSAWAVTPS